MPPNDTTQRSARAGRYQRQLTGYSAFMPEPLPPQPGLVFDDEMHTLLSRADRALGRLDGSIQTLPNPDLFVLMYIRKEAVLSSQIEGTQSSLDDVLEVEASVFDNEHPQDVGEVINYIHAMNYGLKRLETLPLSLRLIKEIHEILLNSARGRDKRPGEFRRTQNWIGPSGCTLSTATFVPPPPDEVMQLLGSLEAFMHDNDHIPILIKIGMIHAQFETIHPFLDGNGRVGRLLITFLLCQKEIMMKPVLYISHFFKEHRSEYYEKLQRIRDYGDWEAWTKFFLRGIATVSLEATETARRIVGLREEHRTLITLKLGRSAGSGLTIMERLYSKPIINVGETSDLLGITYQSANSLIQRLSDLYIIEEITGNKRNRVFRYTPYVSLFSDNRAEHNESNVARTESEHMDMEKQDNVNIVD
ncbi:Fic family protein [Methylobacterium oryzihabitans]|uniref:Fic family protein n=1 Tax=Methylobacterium oryzihabitans TaxID=2499852 RepID=A0A3S2VPP1_9HYPH|nr:Fic family protein [Methylobacterium oryzihabitans]RVU17793.1 Fic family protein [Methylobacterium oryzihabitans]